MKQNIEKYILAVILMFIGLFMINTEVNAEEYVDLMCRYNFVYTQKDVHGNSTTEHDLTFNLVYKNNKWSISGGVWDDGSVAHDVVSFDSNTKYHDFGNGKSCPKVVVYKRKTVTNKFYITSEGLKNSCDQSGKEKVDGYTCKNIYGVYSGTDITDTLNQTCPNDIVNNIKTKLNTNYNTVVSLFNSYNSQIVHATVGASSVKNQEEAKKKCYPIIEKTEDFMNKLEQKFSSLDFQVIIDTETKNSKCVITGSDLLTSFSNRTKNYITGLENSGKSTYDNCVDSAAISEEDKEDLKNDAEKQLDDKQEEIDGNIDAQINNWIEKITNIDLGGDIELDCEGLLGNDLLDLINEIFGYVKIAAPILLIVLGIVDFSQAVLLDDKDALKKATSKFVKRAIVCVVIFFVPLIVNLLLNIAESAGLNLVDDPLCGIK